MSPAVQELEARAIESAAWLLKQAAVFLETNSTQPLFKKTMKVHTGNTVSTYSVLLYLPGVLRVQDATTGQLLAESAPGQLNRLGRRYTIPNGH